MFTLRFGLEDACAAETPRVGELRELSFVLLPPVVVIVVEDIGAMADRGIAGHKPVAAVDGLGGSEGGGFGDE